MTEEHEHVDGATTHPDPVASLQLDAVVLPIYDLQAFNDADLRRVESFVTTFGSWKLPIEVATALATADGTSVLLWIHDTAELVLIGGTPKEGELPVEVTGLLAAEAEFTPAWLGGQAADVHLDTETGMVSESFKAELLPAGSRVAVLAHVEHSPAVHELLWGWRREQHNENGWPWLVERLARLEDQTGNSHLA
jgi:hypothetical protein